MADRSSMYVGFSDRLHFRDNDYLIGEGIKTMKYDIKKRYSEDVIFTASIECSEDETEAVNLEGANLEGANLEGANLRGANLRGAYLGGAKSIYAFSCIGKDRRFCVAIKWVDKVMFQLGCFWGGKSEAIKKIREKYGPNSTYEAQIELACRILDEQQG